MIRVWSRLGNTPDEIQSELDVRYNNKLLSTHGREATGADALRAQTDYFPASVLVEMKKENSPTPPSQTT
jgi:hypothetical protein